MDPETIDQISAGDLGSDGTSLLGGGIDLGSIPDLGTDTASLGLTGPVEGPTASDLGIGDPSNVVASATASNGGGLGSFFSSLAGDATTIIGGATASVSQSQALARAQQLRSNGYTVPLNMPGLGGSFPTSTLAFFLLAGLAIWALAK